MSEATGQVVPLSEARETRRAGPEFILASREPEILSEMSSEIEIISRRTQSGGIRYMGAEQTHSFLKRRTASRLWAPFQSFTAVETND
jgi:hypothetical protein